MEQQSHKQRWLVLAIVVIVVLIGAAVSNMLTGGGTPAGRPTATPSPSQTGSQEKPAPKSQRTLLFQVRDDDRRIVYSSLLATSYGAVNGAHMSIPSNLLVPIPTWTPMRLTGDANDTLQSQHAVEQLLGVDVDISLVLDRLALAGFYDATLEPALAAKAKASPDIDQWVTKALATLPAQSEDAGQLLLSLGHMARSSASNADLVDLLLDIRKDARAKKLDAVTLPVQPVRAGLASSVLRAPTDALMKAHYARTLLTAGQAATPRVVLVPAGASATQLAQATQALIDAGMTVIPGTPGQQVSSSQVSVPISAVALGIGRKVATTLGFLFEEVRQIKGNVVDAQVMLGPDYSPL
ncbi:MAG: hypothetical protein WC005_05685 [Candidatus Nanopelagicales bacterium]